MENFVKIIEDYKEWKKAINSVIDDNLSQIAELIIDTHGENLFISISEDRSQNSILGPFVKHGVVINRNQISNDLYIWFYKNGGFYLIERNDNHALNIAPQYNFDSKYQFINGSLNYRARFEDEIEFVIALLEWSDSLIEILKLRMDKIVPKEARAKLVKVIETAQ